MNSPNNYRLYTFTANLYLSPLQCGLQTAHVVSELAASMSTCEDLFASNAFDDWAKQDKTIVICGAGNHKGVVDCFLKLKHLANLLRLPASIFYEDEQSMNCMATACGVVVPQRYWDTFKTELSVPKGQYGVELPTPYWIHVDEATCVRTQYPIDEIEGQFIDLIKSFRLA